MVGEFPELQGLMGRYYALAQGEKPQVATAIEEHYKPLGPSDRVPTEPVSIAVALADKLDILTGFWTIDEKPTGSKDPYALRRAALGVIRLIVDNGIPLSLEGIFAKAEKFLRDQGKVEFADDHDLASSGLLSFFHDRIKVVLRDSGARHDLVDAVLSEDEDDLLEITKRVKALGELLNTEDGNALLHGYKRAASILADEEKKDGKSYAGDYVERDGVDRSEVRLYVTTGAVQLQVGEALKDDKYADAVRALASLRDPVDAFFEAVRVNDPDPAIRANRLNLLASLRDTMHLVADFGKVAG
jgi:glycyl-tRNA synthetase beta chain